MDWDQSAHWDLPSGSLPLFLKSNFWKQIQPSVTSCWATAESFQFSANFYENSGFSVSPECTIDFKIKQNLYWNADAEGKKQKNKGLEKLGLAKPTSNKANYSTRKPTQILYISEVFIVNYHATIQIPIKIIKPAPFKACKLFATLAKGSFWCF